MKQFQAIPMMKHPIFQTVFQIFLGIMFCVLIPITLKIIVVSPLLNLFKLDMELSKGIQAIISIGIIILTYRIYFNWKEKRIITEFSSEGMVLESWLGFSLGFAIIASVIFVLFQLGYYQGGWVNTIFTTIKPLLLFSVMGVLEEIIFRGVIYRITESKLGTIWALIISSLIFGFIHMSNNNFNFFSGFAIALELGILTGIAFTLTGRLWFPIALHIGWNYALIFFGAIVSGADEFGQVIESKISGPVWATGGSFGPENSIITILLSLLVFAGLYFKTRSEGKIRLAPPRY